jgi:hypothetical protein
MPPPGVDVIDGRHALAPPSTRKKYVCTPVGSCARDNVRCRRVRSEENMFFYAIIPPGKTDWMLDRSVQIFLDPAPEYGRNAVFMLVRCAEAIISADCRFTEFTLEGFGRLSRCARAPNSVSACALHLHFSEIWPYRQSPIELWRSAEVLGLPETGPYRLRSDPDGRQACSRLCHELFGKHPEENSGKVVTTKFIPLAEAMFEQAASATSAFVTPSNALQKPAPNSPGPSSVGEQAPSKRRRAASPSTGAPRKAASPSKPTAAEAAGGSVSAPTGKYVPISMCVRSDDHESMTSAPIGISTA